jgi:hypothetical protein
MTATILDSFGNAVDLTGCTVRFVMRALTASTPTVTAAATVTTVAPGRVQYSWAAADTAAAGIYAATFRVTTTSGGATYTYPNDGYLEISIEENLTSAGGAALVSLGEARDYLNFTDADKSRDAKLVRFIEGVTPVVEAITGPILVRQYDEVYDGGQLFIQLRHRPVVNLLGVSEFRGPIEYSLLNIPDPAHGNIYSVEIDLSRIVRRSAGGGMIAFPSGLQTIHVVYTAGFSTVPANVRDGTLELIRINFQQTQQGRPRAGGGGEAEGEMTGPYVGFFVPGRVREMLQPNKRRPSIA